MLTTCLLGISPLEPDTVFGVTLQGCREGVMEIYSPSASACVLFPVSSLPVTVTVVAPELQLLILSHISSFKNLDYRYLNLITVDFIAL